MNTARPPLDSPGPQRAGVGTLTAQDGAADGQRAAPQRLTPWFGVVGLLLLATLLAAGFVQVRQHALLNASLRHQDDYLVISLYQLETEYLRLREQLQREAMGHSDGELQLRYDVFVSRVRRKLALEGLGDPIRTRRGQGYLVAPAHVTFPGIGHLKKVGTGYQWLPVRYVNDAH